MDSVNSVYVHVMRAKLLFLYHMQKEYHSAVEFGEISSQQASWAGWQTNRHDIALSHKNTAMCAFDITSKCIIGH